MSSDPTLIGYSPDGVHLVVWCPLCGEWHRHGSHRTWNEGEGERSAHCALDRSERFEGYRVRHFTRGEAEGIARWLREVHPDLIEREAVALEGARIDRGG